jgi:glyoxylase-like metal-dependent hydrolase (beta-lactamase superfamily II)
MFTEIIPGVFSVDHQVVEGKNGIILGRRGAMAIDTGNYPAEGQAMVNFIRDRGFVPNRLILTHGHGDHILGSRPFIGAEVFAHSRTLEVIYRHLPDLAERLGKSTADLEAELAWPTVTFTAELHLDLGDRSLRLFPAPGHSTDGICVYLEEEALLFAADTVATTIVPAISDGDSRELEKSLAHLKAMPIEILVPGHGPLMYGSDNIRKWLQATIDYLAHIRDAVQTAMAKGDDPASIMEQIDFETFVGPRLPAEKYGMVKRHRQVVQKIIAEVIK